MPEHLYTIPVNEAFDADTECPICEMVHSLNENALDFTLGPSYMEDDVRMLTDKVGFCERHVAEMYKKGNRLGLALMLKTHADKIIGDIEKKQKGLGAVSSHKIFGKNKDIGNPVSEYINNLNSTCFICNRVNETYKRYIDTMFYLYASSKEFKEKFELSKGFCMNHYGFLIEKCTEYLDKGKAREFSDTCSKIFIENMKRVRDDLSWFIDKFDYRNTDAPWKDSKDALQRMMLKQNSLYYKNPDSK